MGLKIGVKIIRFGLVDLGDDGLGLELLGFGYVLAMVLDFLGPVVIGQWGLGNGSDGAGLDLSGSIGLRWWA